MPSQQSTHDSHKTMPTATPCPDVAFSKIAGDASRVPDAGAMSFVTPAQSLCKGSKTLSSTTPPGPVPPRPFGVLRSTATQGFSSLGSATTKSFRFFGSAAPEPFRFLDLPRDIRLLVYDNLLTRTLKDVTLCIPGAPPHAKITLITPDPIPPVHLDCRLLSQEAGPFLKAKILRMSTPWRAPRLIIHAGPIITLLRDGGVVDQILNRVDSIRDGFNTPMNVLCQQQLPPDMLLRGQMMHDLMVYTKRAGLRLKSMDTQINWPDRDNPKGRSMEAIGRDVDYRITTNELAYYPSEESRDGLLRIAVMFTDCEPVSFDMQVFLDKLSFMCDVNGLQTSVQTFGSGSESFNYVSDNEFFRFDGEMSEKTWKEEWA